MWVVFGEHGVYSAVGKREITCLWRGGSAWVGHVYTWRMLRNAIYGGWGVATTSSSSYKLVVCVEAPGNGACRREMHAKKLPNTVQSCNGTGWRCSLVLYSAGGYSDWNRPLWLYETKLLVGNPQSWTKKPNKLKYRWQDLTLENCSVPGNLLGHIFPETICCHRRRGQFIQAISKLLRFFFAKPSQNLSDFECNFSNMFVVVSSLLLLLSVLKICSTEH